MGREPCKLAGLDYIKLGFHQHGLISARKLIALHKPGTSSRAGDKLDKLKFKKDMIFATDICLHDPKWKKDVGLQMGDTLHLIKDGNRRLVNTPINIIEKKV